ncbi:hypothetical protein QBC40DRAFT_327345 [Triangularia verruculosa]|uniref:CCHC-type domain-containing protein n=1 Tax=Triangularia verruculosa TaxID=2587418 RepID=A0AAN7B1G2_9PEZI|nr:hypothetical protein QBC40DRAFT_327345 [Triangularia verruculosa]
MDRKKQGHVALPLGDFRQCPSARKLFDFLGRAFPVKVNKQRTLNSFVIWLIERIVDKDVSNPTSNESELREWHKLLRSCRIGDQTILDGYIQYQKDHLSNHPLDARRLHMMEADLRALMKIPVLSSEATSQVSKARDSPAIGLAKAVASYPDPGSDSSAEKIHDPLKPPSKPMDDYIHPDRRVSVPRAADSPANVALKSMDDYIHPDRRASVPSTGNDSTTAIGADVSDYIHPGRRALVSAPRESPNHATSASAFGHMHPGRVSPTLAGQFSVPTPENTFGHMHPDRMKASRDATPEPGEWVDEDEEKEKKKETDLSFLTGSNRMVFEDDWVEARKKRKAQQAELSVQSGKEAVDSSETGTGITNSIPSGKSKMKVAVPGNYVCNRCRVPGHLIQDCPTNGNKKFAIKAPEDYTCVKCGKQAGHYVGDCPQKSSFSRGSRNIKAEQSPPRRVVSDPFGDSYRPESRAYKRHLSVDSEVEEVDSTAWTSRPRRKRGRRGSRRDDGEPERTMSIRGGTNRNDFHWSSSTDSVVVKNYIDPDRPARSEAPAKVYINRKHLPASPDPREEGRLSYYDVPSEEAPSKKSRSKRATQTRKAQRVVPKIEEAPARVVSAPPHIRVDIREVGQMIDEEKTKHDLIPAFLKLFVGKEVPRRAKMKRPVATDFIEMPPESEEGDDDAMDIDQGAGQVKQEQDNMPTREANTSVIQHLHGVIDVDDDTIMTEAMPSVIVSGLGDTTDLTELSDGDSPSDVVVVDD